jgi:hypothetical protein
MFFRKAVFLYLNLKARLCSLAQVAGGQQPVVDQRHLAAVSDLCRSRLLLSTILLGLIGGPAAQGADIRITEFMASNVSSLKDEDGDFSDWLELFNSDTNVVDLTGWFLTDSLADLTQWRIPDVTLDRGDYLLIFASGKNKTNVSEELHTNFQLSREGDYLALVDPSTNIVFEYAPAYPPQQANISYGRDRLDPAVEGFLLTPTPGSANQTSGPGFAPEVGFSHDSQHFTHSFSVTLKVVPKYRAAGSCVSGRPVTWPGSYREFCPDRTRPLGLFIQLADLDHAHVRIAVAG